MIKKVMLAVSTLALAVTAAPAVAQGQDQDNDNTTTGASGNNSDNDTVVVNDLIDLFVQDNAADTFSDDDQDNDGNGSLNGNSLVVATQTLSATNTNQNLDEVVDMDGEDDSDTNVGYQSGNNSVRGSAFAAYAGILNPAWNTGIQATTHPPHNTPPSPTLSPTNTNQNLDEVVDMDGEDDSDTNVGYQSGNNSVRGSAFAAYAGILNAAWNTGINANTQAATNIAASGTVSFGDSAPAGGGGGGGD